MKNRKCKRNADKTEFSIIGTPTQRRKLDFPPKHTLCQSITSAVSVLNHRISFDENFNFNNIYQKHFAAVSTVNYPGPLPYSLVYIPFSVAKRITTALVSSILD